MSQFPELDRSNSWICVSPKGQVLEFYERQNALKAFNAGWIVKTAYRYLCDLNKSIKGDVK